MTRQEEPEPAEDDDEPEPEPKTKKTTVKAEANPAAEEAEEEEEEEEEDEVQEQETPRAFSTAFPAFSSPRPFALITEGVRAAEPAPASGPTTRSRAKKGKKRAD